MRTRTDTSRWQTIAVVTAAIAIVAAMVFYAKTPSRTAAVTTLTQPTSSIQNTAVTASTESATVAIEQAVEPSIANEELPASLTLDDLVQDPDPEIREEAQALASLLAQETEE